MPRAAAESRQEHGKTALPPAAHHRHGAGRERRLLGSIYCAANFGGSITAILINTPGDPSASATAYDGYPMAKKGEAGRALGMSTVASAIGGIFSVVVMIVAAPLLARAAYNFGPPEYFALALFGLSMLGAVGAEAGIRNLIAGAFGVLLATIGLDLTTSVERFTFGLPELSEGIGIVPVLTGLFAMSEMLVQASQLHVVPERLALDAVRLPSLADFRKCAKAISMSSVLGTFIGILPALGATTAALISYSETKRWSRHKEEFGKGAIEGVAGPEAANNAAVGGSMVPTLALGIPGSTTTAIILAALLVQGVRPGPHLFNEQPTLLAGRVLLDARLEPDLSRARPLRGEAICPYGAGEKPKRRKTKPTTLRACKCDFPRLGEGDHHLPVTDAETLEESWCVLGRDQFQ